MGEVIVTEEMLEAGLAQCWNFDHETGDTYEMLTAVYIAMRRLEKAQTVSE